MGRWLYNQYTPQVRSSIPTSWQSSLSGARLQFYGIPGSSLLYYDPQFNSTAPNPAYEFYKISFEAAGLRDAPAVSFNTTVQNHATASLVFNDDFGWNAAGVMNQGARMADIWTIAIHEMGHASGLAHPVSPTCGPNRPAPVEVPSIMNVTWTTKRYLTANDEAGIAALY